MKIGNNRENLWKEKVTDTHYVNRERESRYGRWKNEMERNGYKRSNSRNGFWKNGSAASSQRYVRDRQGSRFRSQSGGAGFNRSQTKSRDRAGSQIRPKSDLAKEIKKVMKKIDKLLDELKKDRVNQQETC